MTDPAAQARSREAARSRKAEVAELLSATEGVVGVGLERMADGGWSVRVNVTTAEVAQVVGERVPGGQPSVPVHIRITGTIAAAPGPEEVSSSEGASGPEGD